jgi:hypothetical protein
MFGFDETRRLDQRGFLYAIHQASRDGQAASMLHCTHEFPLTAMDHVYCMPLCVDHVRLAISRI